MSTLVAAADNGVGSPDDDDESVGQDVDADGSLDVPLALSVGHGSLEVLVVAAELELASELDPEPEFAAELELELDPEAEDEPPLEPLEPLPALVLLEFEPEALVVCPGPGAAEVDPESVVPDEPAPRGVPGSTGGWCGSCAGRPCRSGDVGSTGTVSPTAALA